MGTKLVTEDGTPIDGIVDVSWRLNAGNSSLNLIQVTFANIPVEVKIKVSEGQHRLDPVLDIRPDQAQE